MITHPIVNITSDFWWKKYLLLALFFVAQCVAFAPSAQAQVAYGISRTFTYIVNPSTGVFTTPTVANDFATPLGYQASAMAVSPWNGLLYVVERTAGSNTPRIGTWNPATGISTNLGALTGAATIDILRATFCPDGRFYIQGNGSLGGAGSEIFEINPVTRAVIRTIVATGVGTNANGSGDLSCAVNGDLYIVSQTGTAATDPYAFYRLTNAQMVAGGSQAATLVGNMNALFVTSPPVGIVEVDAGVPGCAASPNPCFLISSSGTSTSWAIDSTNATVNTRTVGIGVLSTDMSREFRRDVSVTKTTTPTVLQGTTISYTVTVSNPGPAIAANVSVRDTLTTTIFNVAGASWTCAVVTAGTPTALTTACAAASGSGNLSTTVSLSIGGTVRFVITAPVFITATGTVTNTAVANPTGTVFDPTPTNNITTITSFIQKAANLSVTKTDAITTATAGQFVTYTVTFTNSGPGDANGATVTDVRSAGLSNCTVLSCVATGTSSCPVTPANILNPGGTTLPSFQPSTSVTFRIQCGVTATGL